MIKALIFDLDGTLADTLGSVLEAVNMTMDNYSAPHHTCEDVRLALGNGARMLIKRLLPENMRSDEQVTEAHAHFTDCYSRTYLSVDSCYDGMKNAVEQLAAEGYALAVLSNKPDRYTRGLVAQLFPDSPFKVVRGQTALPQKPDPTVPLDIASRLGVLPEECAFIGDSEVDIRTAKNAGMMSVGCDWGYRSGDELRAEGADRVISHPDALLGLFKKTI